MIITCPFFEQYAYLHNTQIQVNEVKATEAYVTNTLCFKFKNNWYIIPVNYKTDYASIPNKDFPWWVPRCVQDFVHKHFPRRSEYWDGAGLIHDCLYSSNGVELKINNSNKIVSCKPIKRRKADWIFFKAITKPSISVAFKAFIMFLAVRLFGKEAFNKDKIKLDTLPEDIFK